MPIIAENNSTPRVLVPAGTHMARCVRMIHIGTIIENTGMYAGREVNKVRITWETPDELHDFGKGLQPFLVDQEFTLSMGEKANLRKLLEGWRGKAFTEEEAKQFDITRLLGKPCMLSVIHKTSKAGKERAEISSATALPKGFSCPDQVNQSTSLSFDNFDEEVFNGLPDFLKNKIKSSKEYSAMLNPTVTEATAVAADNNDDLPF